MKSITSAGSSGDADATIILSSPQDGTVEDLDESTPGSTEAAAPSSTDSAAASTSGAPAADERASSSGAGPEMTLAGEDVTPLVEMLQAREGDEAYAQGTSWGTYQELSPLKRRWQVVSLRMVLVCYGSKAPEIASKRRKVTPLLQLVRATLAQSDSSQS